ncbi:cell wall hydrolase [Wenxinia saemankumensis]|uniref:Cell Wall Hydrolase n=1 Tax=Wenxinia saemankumensis TaxID=1447782 RepID=A0A1M6HC91_9RHOB|nr:cell wall hydrolase [Wenxinia saemankumensis]SHJ19835.1 Cell Wall Hydrolase [Wenxinia saemankumensis]
MIRSARAALLLAVLAALAACARDRGPRLDATECLARAMYFESIRSSRDGLIAVGTVVMNRVASPAYPDDVCGVVGQPNQFAAGVLTRDMTGPSAEAVRAAARSVLRGERHPLVGRSEFFHAATYRAGYDNMHYTVTTGGNAFYERRRPELVTSPLPLPPTEGLTRG